jgi:hypothetical protein
MGSGSVSFGAGVGAGDSMLRFEGRAGRAGGCSSPSKTLGGVSLLAWLEMQTYLRETRDADEGSQESEIRALIVETEEQSVLLIETRSQSYSHQVRTVEPEAQGHLQPRQ